MRSTLVGLLVLLLGSSALAQPAEGDVETIGFDGYYRPNACVPMKLRLRPKIGTPAMYKLAVLQEDMDGDRVLYSRPFTLNGNPEGSRIEEKVWVYFLPQPRNLRGVTTAELKNVLRIFLCTPAGRQITQLDILPGTPAPRDLDDQASMGTSRGARLILMVGTSQSQPFRSIYQLARGIMEDVVFQPINIDNLPENSIGYQAVDAIVWLNADPMELKPETAAAIQEYVRNGGRLVVCQNALTWQKMLDSALYDLLPVTPTGAGTEKGLASLRKLAESPEPKTTTDARTGRVLVSHPWADKLDADAPIVRAELKPGAFVNLWQAADPSNPYLARWVYGMGSVAWTAQDFGDPSVLSVTNTHYLGWERVWDRTFDWRNRTITLAMAGDASIKKDFETVYRETRAATDLSRAMIAGMEAPSKGAALVALAILFFIIYWLAAGPGSYFFLLARKRAHLSWIAYGAAAVAATLLTMLIVKLVLRGPPQLYHVTFVRVDADQQAVAHSQFGLYIPRDGAQKIELKETDPKRSSFVIPFPGHPDQMTDRTGFTAYLEYEVPMRDRTAGEPPAIEVPYRSSLKKFRAQWAGQLPGAITGRARLADGRLTGRLTNDTGGDLYGVYLVYTPSPAQSMDQFQDDWMIEVQPAIGPAWPKGASLELADLTSIDRMKTLGIRSSTLDVRSLLGTRGKLNFAWMNKDTEDNWASSMYGRMDQTGPEDLTRAAVLMSVYDRLEPSKGNPSSNAFNDRFELLRRGGRHLDASAAVSGGHLLIIAQSRPKDGKPTPLPFPIDVDGERVAGNGITFYQFIIPMERSGAATQPADAQSTD